MRFWLICVMLGAAGLVRAQPAPRQTTVRYAAEPIVLDGLLDEPAWRGADGVANFWQYFPQDTVRSVHDTEVRFLYDETGLYVAIVAEAPHQDFVVSTLRRDFSGPGNDNVTIMFDTFRDGANAYAFGVTPYGVRREALVANGGATRGSFNTAWDTKWRGESKMTPTGFTAELFIPFTSIKFAEGGDRWRYRAYRFNLQTNERSTSVQLPQTQILSNLAFMDELVFERPLGQSRNSPAIIPYVNALAQRDFELAAGERGLQVGGDAKIAIGTGMNLDLTVNPDFSNVEVDAIFTNLTRFEVRLPERRQFFIDNGDLFASFGNTFNEARPFFSRRIGLARDTADNLIQNRILAGARLSGKLDENWRLGVLNIQTASDRINGITSTNNAMLALQRRVARRSTLGAFWVNRQHFDRSESDPYNRVLGIDYNLASADSKWTGRAYLHRSLDATEDGNYSSQAIVTYTGEKWLLINDATFVGETFRADLGFVPRRDIFKNGHLVRRFFFPANRRLLNRHSLSVLGIQYRRPTDSFRLLDYFIRTNWIADFTNQSQLTIGHRFDYLFLNEPFDPTRTEGGEPLPADVAYEYHSGRIEYRSSPRGLFTFRTEATLGAFFNGQRYSFGGELAYRLQPLARFSLAFNYDGIRLPDPFPDADLWLLSPRFDFTFSRSLFSSMLFQYSNQRNNFGVNARLQWRFAPLSDLFLVYNDNYFVTDFGPRFRSINLKCTYWLNW